MTTDSQPDVVCHLLLAAYGMSTEEALSLPEAVAEQCVAKGVRQRG
jgi:hypothetical protein